MQKIMSMEKRLFCSSSVRLYVVGDDFEKGRNLHIELVIFAVGWGWMVFFICFPCIGAIYLK